MKDSTSASRKDVLGIQWGHLYSLESREGKRNYSYIDRSKIYFWLIFSCLSYSWVVDTYKVVTNIAFWMKKLFVAGSVVRLIFAHRKLHKKALSSISWFNWRMLIYTNIIPSYSLRAGKGSRLGQRHDLQNTTLTSYYYKNIYEKVIYVYFYKNIFQDKSIHIILTFANSIT